MVRARTQPSALILNSTSFLLTHAPWKRKIVQRERNGIDLEVNIRDFILDMMTLNQENIGIKTSSNFSKVFTKCIIYLSTLLYKYNEKSPNE